MHALSTFKPDTRFYRSVALSSFVLCLVALLVFGPSGHDDSHITYSAAKFFADGSGVRNINGDTVEQGSSFLHVVVLGLLHKVTGISLVTIGPLFSLLMAVACIPVTFLLASHIGVHRCWLPVLLLSLSTAFSYWSMGGLESTLVALLILYCVFSIKSFLFDGYSISVIAHLLLSIIAFLLVRPESFFVLMAAMVAVLLFAFNEKEWPLVSRKMVVVIVMIAVIFCIVCMMRYLYFGQIFPQPVYAKSDNVSFSKLGFGLAYFIYAGQLSIIVYTMAAFLPLIYWFKKIPLNNTWLMVALPFLLANISFIIATGGDWMGGGRFFVPVLPLMVCVFCYYVQSFKYRNVVVTLVLLSSMVEVVVFSQWLSTGVPVYQTEKYKASFTQQPDWSPYSWTETSNYIHTRDLQLINAINPVIASLVEKQPQPLVIASIQMGMIPYHLRLNFADAIYFVDMRGLTTRHVADCGDFDKIQKIWTGIFVSYSEYFAAYQKGQCKLPRLDIVYDLLNRTEEDNRKRLETFRDNNYHIVYRQDGVITGLNSKKQLNTPVFIAVRDELFQQLPVELRSRYVLLTNKPENK